MLRNSLVFLNKSNNSLTSSCYTLSWYTLQNTKCKKCLSSVFPEIFSVSWNLPEGWLHSFFPYTQTLSLLSSSSSPLSLFFFLGNLRGVGWGGTRSRIQTIPIDCVVNLPNNWCILPSFFIDMWLSISKSWQALPILELGMEGGGAEARGFWIPEEYTLLKSLLWLGQLISSSLSEKLSSSLTRVPRCCRTRDLKSLYFFLILFYFYFVLCEWVLWLHVCLCTTSVQCSQGAEEGVRHRGITFHLLSYTHQCN